jgi:hypothetical protein
MANINHTITFVRSDDDHSIGTTVVMAAASEYMSGRKAIGVSEEYIEIDADILYTGHLYVRNMDADNPIKFGFDSGSYPCRIYPGEQGSIPLDPSLSRVYFVADTSTCDMYYEVTSRADTLDVIASPSASPSASVSATPTASPSASPSPT